MNILKNIKLTKETKYTNVYVCENGCRNTEVAITIELGKQKNFVLDNFLEELIWSQCKDLKCIRCRNDMMFSFGSIKK